MKAERLTDELWEAIVSNDESYDFAFLYAIATTRIFCKPSCKSRVPKRENVYIFQNANDALSAHFRPCKRCRPLDKRLPDQTWVDQITEFIDKHYSDPLTLQTIADRCHGSPYHLHRTFKRIKGMTPSEYIQQLRIGKAARTLIQTNQKINDIAKATGIPNTSYFITVFKKMTGLTPNEYRYYKKGYSDFMVEKDL